MGSFPYYYFTKYQPDINSALQTLRQQEFQAGRYDPAMNMHDPKMWMFNFNFPPTADSLAPGAQHDSIQEALEDAGESGTGSILDIQAISNMPEIFRACGLTDEELQEMFGTNKPSRHIVEVGLAVSGKPGKWDSEAIERQGEFFETMDRGEGRYIVIYENDEPSEIFFVGFSLD